jgi:ABC-type nitrate/sulfonate/bicarbonate transport system ATPase subunit
MIPSLQAADVRGTTAQVEASSISKTYRIGGHALPALRDVSLAAERGEFVCILGPSGCGKTTLLNIIAGLDRPDEGRVVIDGTDVTGCVGSAAYMPQKDLLLPWKTILDNVTLGLEVAGVSRSEARLRAAPLIPQFGLAGFERARPSALSGGMRQRVALLRTVLTGRETLLLDEPFGALDALTRVDLQGWLLDIAGSLGKTVILVTHDIDEALYLSDRVYVMTPRPGAIEAVLDVPIARPRQYESTVTSPTFAALKRTVLQLLSGHESGETW